MKLIKNQSTHTDTANPQKIQVEFIINPAPFLQLISEGPT